MERRQTTGGRSFFVHPRYPGMPVFSVFLVPFFMVRGVMHVLVPEEDAPEGDFVLDQLVSGLLATPCIRRRLDQHYKSELQVVKEGLPELPELPPISGGALD